ncbi:MAG: TMEM175 family protein [Ilumatobacteraceae bacterium]
MSALPEQLEDGESERLARLSDTSRVEAFSDGVFAIVIILLVLDLRVPDDAPGRLVDGLLEQWPPYAAYLTSFLYVGIVWQNHHAAFGRIRDLDRGLHWVNLGILLTSALLPFPTAVLSFAVRSGMTSVDARAAVALYATVGALLCVSWYGFFRYLATHPHLLENDVEEAFFQRECVRALLGALGYLLAGLAGYTLTPAIALVVFIVIPAFFGLTSQGMSELQMVVRRQGDRRHPRGE